RRLRLARRGRDRRRRRRAGRGVVVPTLTAAQRRDQDRGEGAGREGAAGSGCVHEFLPHRRYRLRGRPDAGPRRSGRGVGLVLSLRLVGGVAKDLPQVGVGEVTGVLVVRVLGTVLVVHGQVVLGVLAGEHPDLLGVLGEV